MPTDKKWTLRPTGDSKCIKHLAEELSIDTVLANLLVQRGVTTYDEAQVFFKPKLENLHDPFLMKDMEKAVERISLAISSNEAIMIYGDYDVDGTTAVSLVYLYFKKLYNRISFYIPDRYSEGYGISYQGIDHAKETGITLIIVLDCGIKSIEKIAYAKNLGVDFIVCDHHLPGDTIPDAVAVLNPKRVDCPYPFTELSGCGVGFKLIQAYSITKNLPEKDLYSYLDLLAVSIASDMAPVIGENRILAFYGLKRLNEDPRKGLKSIIKISGLENHRISIDDIVFKIGPRINAAGRMESGRAAVDLLTSETDESAAEFGKTINLHNNDRKNVDRIITQEAIAMVVNNKTEQAKKATVLYNPEWHKGVIGIVASRLIESFYKPTIVLTNSNGLITGSARSIPGFDLYQAIESCADLLENFGGHMYATGLTLKEVHLDEFKRRFEEIACKNITADMIPQIEIDNQLDFEQITPKFFRILKQFQPFGPGNLSPTFMTQNLYDNHNGRIVGQDGEHLRLELIQEKKPNVRIPAIGFNMANHFLYLSQGNPIDACYSITENYYRGIVNIQLRLHDIKEKHVKEKDFHT